MALLKTQNGQKLSEVSAINTFLAELGVELATWTLPKDPELKSLLQKNTLSDDEKAQILNSLKDRFAEQQKAFGYKTQDLVCLTAEVLGIDDLLAKFDRIHTHSDDEVRYIIEGKGIFGFILPNNEQCLLEVEAEEYIRVPAETEHWFLLDASKRIKAVRYFVSPEGWVANYTNKEITIVEN